VKASCGCGASFTV